MSTIALERLAALRREAAVRVFESLVTTGALRPGQMEVLEIFVAGYISGSGYGFLLNQGGNHVGAVTEERGTASD